MSRSAVNFRRHQPTGQSVTPYDLKLLQDNIIEALRGLDLTVADNITEVTNNISGGAGTPATSVVTETAFGQASVVGVSTNYARQDHTHGTPAAPAAPAEKKTLSGYEDPGTVTLVTAQWMFQYKRLTLTTTERFSAAGNTRLIVSNFNLDAPNNAGYPKNIESPFNVARGYELDILEHLTLSGPARATLEGTARLSVYDDGSGRLSLSGRG